MLCIFIIVTTNSSESLPQEIIIGAITAGVVTLIFIIVFTVIIATVIKLRGKNKSKYS